MTEYLIERLRKYSKILLPCTHEAADALEAQDARIAELEAALKEVHRRTGLLMTQNQGRWNMSLEHDRRTADVLSVNQDISSAALGEKNDN